MTFSKQGKQAAWKRHSVSLSPGSHTVTNYVTMQCTVQPHSSDMDMWMQLPILGNDKKLTLIKLEMYWNPNFLVLCLFFCLTQWNFVLASVIPTCGDCKSFSKLQWPAKGENFIVFFLFVFLWFVFFCHVSSTKSHKPQKINSILPKLEKLYMWHLCSTAFSKLFWFTQERHFNYRSQFKDFNICFYPTLQIWLK